MSKTKVEMPSGGASLSIRENGLLKRGRALPAHPQRLAVEHCLGHGQAPRRGHDPRQGVRDVVEVAGVDPHLLTPAMDLDPDPVELPLDR